MRSEDLIFFDDIHTYLIGTYEVRKPTLL
jgi:hypothetical protein